METNQPLEHTNGLLQKGQIIPAFTLPGADGMPHGPWDYKQRDNLILLFTRSSEESETRGLLRTFVQHYAVFREEQCAVLAISADTVIANLRTQQALNLPFALLADPKGEVIMRYTSWNNVTHTLIPSIVLTDRYGALHQQWLVEQEASLPPIAELLASLHYLNSICTP